MKAGSKFALGLFIVIVVAAGGWYAWQNHAGTDALANISSASKLSDAQVSEVIARVSKFLVLPAGETPSVSVVSSAEELAAQQSFYRGAKDGDILITYSSRAILYDPKDNRLVNVGPIVRNETPAASPSPTASASFTPTPAVTPSPLPTIVIDVRNGTKTAGLASATARELKKTPAFTIGVLADAQGVYKETVVVDLTKPGDAKAATVAELAKLLGVTAVTKIPSGEQKSTADALVIVGK